MIETTLRDDDSYVDSLFEARAWENLIVVGSDMERLERLVFVEHKDTMLDKFLNYTNLTDFVTDNVENSLTHETIHIILDRESGAKASTALDKIDKNYEISGVRGCT